MQIEETKAGKRYRRFIVPWVARPALGVMILLSIIASGRLAWWWAHYPRIPDVTRISFDDAAAFMAGDDFNRLTAADRRRFALAAIERLNEKRFGDLLAMLLQRGADRQRAAKNVRSLPREDRDAVADRFGQLFLDKFFQEPPAARTGYLTAFAIAERADVGQHPERFGLPKPEQMKAEMSRFFTRQPPHVQAEAGQFMTDLRRQRDVLGIRQPWQQAGR